jgi:two-component system NarL family sensor kinase
MRIATMYAMVGVVNFIFRMERTRRKEAVAAERVVHQENIVLERRAVEAEQTLQLERIRISEDIHNGAAQSAYVMSLGLEACRNLVKDSTDQLAVKLTAIHAVAKQAIWELRYPINLGPVFEGKDLVRVLETHVDNFQTISSIPTTFEVVGPKRDLPVLTTQRLFSIAHNAMTNAYRHAEASKVDVRLNYQNGTVRISIADNGVGLSDQDLETVAGHGIRNIRRMARELGGVAEIDGKPGTGTIVSCTVPLTSDGKETE